MCYKQNFGPLKGDFPRKTWQSNGMVYMIIMDVGHWFIFTFSGRGMSMYTYMLVQGESSFLEMGLPQG